MQGEGRSAAIPNGVAESTHTGLGTMRDSLAIDGVYLHASDGGRPFVSGDSDPAALAGAGRPAVESDPGGSPGRVLVFGDSQDDESDGYPYMGHAARIRVCDDDTVLLQTSLTGFPPLFRYHGPGPVVVSSSVLAIARTPGVRLELDPRGVAEWIHLGKPVGHRTLFRDVSVIPAGVTLRIGPGGGCEEVERWAPSGTVRFEGYPEYLEAQGEALRAAVRRTDTSRSFLSLTAGLDTRAVLACLAGDGHLVEAITLSGRGDSLDARRARALSRALGFRHRVLHQDDTFFSNIEDLSLEAIRLSGGLSGLDGAFEVHMYREVGGGRRARISGNLGNQIGRSGTEGVGIRALSPEWFVPQVQEAIRALPAGHWHDHLAPGGGGMGPLELIQQESLFASLGNASIGAALGLQQAPYADRTMIENKCAEPVDPASATVSSGNVRVRDLRHRFLGEPALRSFQRQVVMRTGGPVASIPITWGGRPAGGVSLPAAVMGFAAGADAFLSRKPHLHRAAAPVTRALGMHGLNGFGGEPLWEHPRCRTFILDNLRDAAAGPHPLLDRQAVTRLMAGFDRDEGAAEAAAAILTLVLTCRMWGIGG